MSASDLSIKEATSELFTTFFVNGEYFGIEVMKVQEVTGNPTITSVPLAPEFVRGLINLRGQLATALGLRELFGAKATDSAEQMSVVCRLDGNLVSLLVDQIGDVVEAEKAHYEPTPDTVPQLIKKFVKGVYKMNGTLLSVLDLNKISNELSPNSDVIDGRSQN